ncbi:hypothetical protein A5702_04790 [Mycobacterium sp. E3339]|nr:hypothetical protein A5702_04790 [Mycobacterium sp. E3339]
MPPTCPAGMPRGATIGAPAPAKGAAAGAAASGAAAGQLAGTDKRPTGAAWPMAADGISRAGASISGAVIAGRKGARCSIAGIAGRTTAGARTAVLRPAPDVVIPLSPDAPAPPPCPNGVPSKLVKPLIADGKPPTNDDADELSDDGSPMAA